MADSTTLTGRIAVITGGSRGIGHAIARALVSAGASVLITGRSADDVETAARRLRGPASGGREAVEGFRADVRRPDEAQAAVEAAVKRFGGLDILVNNAGVGMFEPVADMSVDTWQQIVDTNISGPFYCSHAAIPHLKRRGGGWIINISSLAGKNPFPGGAAYCASKAALNAFSEALMQEVRYDNIRVSYIMPGSVATDFGGRGTAGGDWKVSPDDVAALVSELVTFPLRSLPSRIELRPSKPPRK
jgi:NAD(P)-dependent dehydrogenase (short-subunit alcohol dehydrogenase family)